MNESPTHFELVGKLLAWISANYSNTDSLCVFRDGLNVRASDKPPLVGSFFPDVFAEDTPPTLTIIGEAKTAADLETQHSRKQFRAFIEYLRVCENPHLVVATPWHAQPTAKTIISLITSELRAAHVRVTFI